MESGPEYLSILCSLEKRLEVRITPAIWRRAIQTLIPHTYTAAGVRLDYGTYFILISIKGKPTNNLLCY